MNTNRKIKIITWNVRGLNDKSKRSSIRNFIKSKNPDIVCLQETKLSLVPENIYRQIFGRRYDKGICLLAQGTSGGIILTWKKSMFTCDGRILKENVITADLRLMMDDQMIKITGVYGPTIGTHRTEFLQQIREQKPMHDEPWMICGDFNLILKSQERTSGNM
jgi:exonuclease III